MLRLALIGGARWREKAGFYILAGLLCANELKVNFSEILVDSRFDCDSGLPVGIIKVVIPVLFEIDGMNLPKTMSDVDPDPCLSGQSDGYVTDVVLD